MERLVSNLDPNAIRTERMQGREWIVAPVTLIVPGVLDGSAGPLLYTAEDTSADPGAWDGMPLVVYHPEGEDGGPISARNPSVLDAAGVGSIYGTRWDPEGGPSKTGALVAQAWMDAALLRNVDAKLPQSARLLPALKAGKPVSISTGLFTRNDPSEGVWKTPGGKEVQYQAVARDHKPDHVAILPDVDGACSVRDGCGILVNKGAEEARMKKNELIKFLTTNCSCWKGKVKLAVLNSMDEEQLQVIKDGVVMRKLTANLKAGKRDLRSITLNADGEGEAAGVSITDLAALFGITTDPAADPAGYMDELRAKVTEVLDKIGGPATPAPEVDDEVPVEVNEDDDEDKPKPTGNRKPAPVKPGKPAKLSRKEYLEQMPDDMREWWNAQVRNSAKQRQSLIERIVSNSASTDEGKDKLRKAYAKLSDDDLATLAEEMQVGNNAALDPLSFTGAPRFDGAGGAPVGNSLAGEDDLLEMPGLMAFDSELGQDEEEAA